jgi:hypothetical protein
LTIVQADPFQSSARVRLCPCAVWNPTARQWLLPHDKACRPDPLPAEIGLAGCQVEPFQNWLVRSPARVMQLFDVVQATTPAQAQDLNSPQMPPRPVGDASAHVLVVASQVLAVAMLAPA